MTPEGWYDDPVVPGGKRYWDGTQWTERAQPPPASPGPIPQAQGAPPQVPPPVGGYQAPPQWGPQGEPPFSSVSLDPGSGSSATYRGPGLDEVGSWISRSFRMVFAQIGPLSLLYLIGMLVYAVAYLLLDQGVRGGIITDDGEFLGFNTGLLIAAGVIFFLSIFVGMTITLAAHYSLYAGHVGHSPGVQRSLSAGLRATPRYLGVIIALYLAFLLFFGLLVGVAAALSLAAGGSDGALTLVLVILLYVIFIVASVWLSVKLAFVTVGAAVIPRGMSVLRTAWNATQGYFWGIFGRQLLLSLIASMIGMVAYVLFYVAAIVLIFTQFGFSDDGGITVDGQDIETLNVFEVGDFLPNPMLVILMFSVIGYLIHLVQSLVYSGTTALYADLRGPNTLGHGAR